uniref:RNA-directed DNA polymerase, eukaryota n=1 Tax=Tanacetum cinerariifolium TaxID=118510 RepID=A0A699HDN0_TANCI|nr:hypothetical protein [Tanacetum cinerariifolium]
MEALRRSGRFRGHMPIVEENTIDEAINVHKEDSDDDFVVVSYPTKQVTRSNATPVKWTKRMIIARSPDSSDEIKGETANVAKKDTCADTEAGHSKKLSVKMLRLRNEGINILMNEVSGNKEMIQDWKDQFDVPEKDITPSIIKSKIKRSTMVDFNFKLNIIMLFANMMGCCKKTGSCGFGLDEKEGPFMEEDENGFLDDLEKSGNYIEAIHKSNSCFEKTLAIGLEVFPNHDMLIDLKEKYVQVMNLQTGGGDGHNNFQTGNSSASVGKSGEIDKAELLEIAEQVTSAKLKGKAVDVDDIPSFSLAVDIDDGTDSKVEKQVTIVKGNTLSNVPLTPSLITPALVLDDSCVSVCDLSRHVMGRVKDLNSIPNLRTLLTKERFSDVKLTYLGGMWVMIEFDNEATKLKLQEMGETMDIEKNLVSSFAQKRLCIKTKQADNILEKFKVIFKGKVYMAHAKELFTWTPIFLDHKESEYISDDESLHGAKNKSVGSQHGEDDLLDDSDVEGVSETFFGDKHPSPNNSVCNSSEKVVEQKSEDPFVFMTF